MGSDGQSMELCLSSELEVGIGVPLKCYDRQIIKKLKDKQGRLKYLGFNLNVKLLKNIVLIQY
jgi:hypothetical protein